MVLWKAGRFGPGSPGWLFEPPNENRIDFGTILRPRKNWKGAKIGPSASRGALCTFQKWSLERVRKTIQNALRNMRHLYFRKGRNHAKVWAGDEIQGFHGSSVMQENVQKGMPQSFKNDPKVALRNVFFDLCSFFCDFVGGRKIAIFSPLAETSKNLQKWAKGGKRSTRPLTPRPHSSHTLLFSLRSRLSRQRKLSD